MSDYAVFHNAQADLAEGLLVDDPGQRLFWVDINKQEVYQKSLSGRTYAEYPVESSPTALLRLEESRLTLCNSLGLAVLDLDTREITQLSETPDTGSDDDFRSNDGVSLPGGRVIYGTMQCAPTGNRGALYFYDGEITKPLGIPVGIPNGFILLEEGNVLIADSLAKQVNLYKLDQSNLTLQFQSCWHDFSSDCFTPDGGCTDYNGKVYFALWDGNGVAVLDYSGNLVEIIDLPVPRPTNCKLAGEKRLLVTTAREGLSRDQLQEAPLSGSVLEIQLR